MDNKKQTEFLKEAFCIDGNCEYIRNVEFIAGGKEIESELYALEDSKRGKFYVTIGKAKNG